MTKPSAKQRSAQNKTLAALPLPSEETLRPWRRDSARRHDADVYTIRLSTFRRALANGHITINAVREMWLEWYGQYWDEVAGEVASSATEEAR